MIAGIPVTYGIPVTGYLFGELPSRDLNFVIYADLNNNGTYEYNEPGIGGESVELSGLTYRGVVVSVTRLTDFYGMGSFSGIAPGVYTLTETQPMTWSSPARAAHG